jgi:hypothetical protein
MVKQGIIKKTNRQYYTSNVDISVEISNILPPPAIVLSCAV